MRGVFSKMLELGGYSPVEAGTGEEALELLGTGVVPAAVLLDLRMPGMGGLGFLSRLRQEPQGTRIPVAVITGDSFIDHALERAIAALGASIHFKPIDIDEILSLTTALISFPSS